VALGLDFGRPAAQVSVSEEKNHRAKLFFFERKGPNFQTSQSSVTTTTTIIVVEGIPVSQYRFLVVFLSFKLSSFQIIARLTFLTINLTLVLFKKLCKIFLL
jgi:hypothetical protein